VVCHSFTVGLFHSQHSDGLNWFLRRYAVWNIVLKISLSFVTLRVIDKDICKTMLQTAYRRWLIAEPKTASSFVTIEQSRRS
jgi:hypothetical protein